MKLAVDQGVAASGGVGGEDADLGRLRISPGRSGLRSAGTVLPALSKPRYTPHRPGVRLDYYEGNINGQLTSVRSVTV